MNQLIKKTEELLVKAKVMSKWYEWDALQKLVTPEQYQESTLCKFVSQIEDKIVFEYDCYFRFAKTQNQIGYFYFFYYEAGILMSKRYIVFYYGTHTEIKLEHRIQIGYRPNVLDLDDYTFIGNWKDGQEYLSKQILELGNAD